MVQDDGYVLVTGAAGFIGSYLSDLIASSHRLVLIDSFDPQVHGDASGDRSSIIKFDIAVDSFDLLDWFGEPKAIVHLAAKTGTSQSMYELENYYSTNVVGLARLLDFALKKKKTLRHFVFTSSRSVYGEGSYFCDNCKSISLGKRRKDYLDLGLFEVNCNDCGAISKAVGTKESSILDPRSHYALTKLTNESQISLALAKSEITFCNLRLQNVIGVGQSLQNPYTGVLGIFASLALAGKPLSIFENGKIARDFVSVKDIARVISLCLEREDLPFSLNVGSGVASDLVDVARSIVSFYGSSSVISTTSKFRDGDIAVNFADLTLFHSFFPEFEFERIDFILPKYLEWVRYCGGLDLDKFASSMLELQERGLISK
jgi:dTDP-L-rhamnose 4-epimerase